MSKEEKKITLRKLAELVNCELVGDEEISVKAVAGIESAGEGELTFASDIRAVKKIPSTKASAVIVSEKIDCKIPQLIAENVDLALIKALEFFASEPKKQQPCIHPSAIIAESAKIADSAYIGPWVRIGENVVIGEKCFIDMNCSIDQDVQIGKNCCLAPGVIIYRRSQIGNNCNIKPHAVIGAAGYAYCFAEGRHNPIPHNGAAVIEDFVDIGAMTCVDRGKFGNTVIGAGTKIDSLVMIAHNVVIGKCCLIVSQVGVAGSVKIGDGVVLGGKVGLRDHITIGSGAKIGASSAVPYDIEPNAEVVGSPPVESKEKLRQLLALNKLPELLKDFKKLTGRVKKLEDAKNNS